VVVRSVPAQVLLLAGGQQQLQLLFEQAVIVGHVIAEQRIGLGEGTTAGDNLRPATGEQVQRGELLEQPHRILGRQHRDGGGQAQRGGLAGDGGQHHFGGRDGEVLAVVFAKPQEGDARLIGDLRQLDQLFQALAGR